MIRSTVNALLTTVAFIALENAGEIAPLKRVPLQCNAGRGTAEPMVLEVDFDGREDVLRQFNARPQRTLQPVALRPAADAGEPCGRDNAAPSGVAGSVVCRHRPVRWHHRLCPWGTQANCFAPGALHRARTPPPALPCAAYDLAEQLQELQHHLGRGQRQYGRNL
jgi:hypothetical protein